MKQNTQPEKQSLTPMQKQAVLVCIVCALAVLLTIGITWTVIKRGKSADEPDGLPDSTVTDDGDLADHYQIDETSTALLAETADAGEEYLKTTVFLGDSNTVRLYGNGLIDLDQFCAKEGIGTQAALNEGIVTFKNDSSRYTMAQAVGKMKPRRVVIMLGTNDTGMDTDTFIGNYTALIQAIQASYPYTDIIVNTVPPVPENHSNYPHMDQAKIDDFNMALLTMCEQLGVKFLNSAEALKGEDGYGKAEYFGNADIHLSRAGQEAMLSYLRTHVYVTEDRRPASDLNNIPKRTLVDTSGGSAAVADSSSASSEPESSSTSAESYEIKYRVDKTGGGTLTCGSDSGKTTLTYSAAASQSVTVTAVPDNGYVFVQWSDGKTENPRKDSGFTQNMEVTALFGAATVQITGSGSTAVDGTYTFRAKLGGKYLTADSIRWYADGSEVAEYSGKDKAVVTIVPALQGHTFKVYAIATYNGCQVKSNTLEVTVPVAASSSSSSSSSGSHSTSSSSSSSASSSSSSSSPAASSGATSSSSTASSASNSTSHSSSSSSSSSHSSSTSSSASGSHSTSTADSGSHSGASSSEAGSAASSASTSHSSSAASSGSASSSTASSASTEESASREASTQG